METHGSSIVARRLLAACGLALPLMVAGQASAIISSGPGGFNGLDINTYLGAQTYYNAGFTGTRTLIGNLEAGSVWNAHQSTSGSQISYYIPAGAQTAPTPQFPANTPNYDFHATQVGQTMIGTPGNDPLQRGIAYGSRLLSTNVATSWSGTGTFLSSFSTTFAIAQGAFNSTLRTGVPVNGVNSTVDVSNSSWGAATTNGFSTRVISLDVMIYDSKKVVVASAGNNGPTAGTFSDLGYAKNTIAVGALTGQADATPFNTVASFSSRGPGTFLLPTAPTSGTNITGVRAAVDISAPGDQLTLAAYLGKSGGNRNAATNDLSNNFYFTNSGGTSFSSPIVTGGAALMVDAAKAFGYAKGTDGRVVKAIMLNAADKTAGWTNNATVISGVNTTTQGLDWITGAGRLNLTRTFFQQNAGTRDVAGTAGGNVLQTGWDFGNVASGTPNRYQIDSDLLFGHDFDATLSWWAKEQFDLNTLASASVGAGAQDRLTLQLFRGEVSNLGGAVLVAESVSTYNLNQHIHFTIPQTGKYFIQVNWAQNLYNFIGKGANEDYGLAWGTVVPTPGAGVLVLAGVVAMGRRRR